MDKSMHQFEEVIQINNIPYSYGPHGYAYYYHERKETWEMSASISNAKLEQMLIENENIDKFTDMDLVESNPNISKVLTNLNPTSIDILNQVTNIQSERAKEYEQAGGERSFERIVNIFNAYKGTNLLPSDIALMLRILKEVRSEHSEKPHLDSFIDSTSYESLRCELRIKEKSST